MEKGPSPDMNEISFHERKSRQSNKRTGSRQLNSFFLHLRFSEATEREILRLQTAHREKQLGLREGRSNAKLPSLIQSKQKVCRELLRLVSDERKGWAAKQTHSTKNRAKEGGRGVGREFTKSSKPRRQNDKARGKGDRTPKETANEQ